MEGIWTSQRKYGIYPRILVTQTIWEYFWILRIFSNLTNLLHPQYSVEIKQ